MLTTHLFRYTVRPSAAAVSVATADGCRDARCRQGAAAGGEEEEVGQGDGDGEGDGEEDDGSAATVDTCLLLYLLYSGGPARPLGYLRAETPTRGEPAGPSTPGPPGEVGLPAGEGWADTGSAGSVDIDPDSPAAATFGLTVILDGEEDVATGATSLGSTSPHSLGRGAFDRVK